MAKTPLLDTLGKQSDAALIEQARAGEQAAFAELVRRYEGKVGATVVGMLGNTAEAEDVAQEVFIRFYRSLERYRGEAALGTYLTRIAINCSLTALEKRKRWGWLRGKQVDPSTLDIPDHDLDPAQRETQQAVQTALLRLPADFRSVVVLRMIEGYSTQETADMLDLPQGTVLSRLARGQKKLREIMEKMGVGF